MKTTTFGCLNLFQMTASPQNAYMPTRISKCEQADGEHERLNLFNSPAALLGNPQAFDTDIGAATSPSPYVGRTARGDWVGIDLEKIARNSARRRKGCMVGADGLEFVQTLSIDILCDRNDVKSLKKQVDNPARRAEERARALSRKSTNRTNSDPRRLVKYCSSSSFWIKQ